MSQERHEFAGSDARIEIFHRYVRAGNSRDRLGERGDFERPFEHVYASTGTTVASAWRAALDPALGRLFAVRNSVTRARTRTASSLCIIRSAPRGRGRVTGTAELSDAPGPRPNAK